MSGIGFGEDWTTLLSSVFRAWFFCRVSVDEVGAKSGAFCHRPAETVRVDCSGAALEKPSSRDKEAT
jgi:hypothetical protein